MAEYDGWQEVGRGGWLQPPHMLVEEEVEMLWLVEVREGAGDWWKVTG